MKISILGSGSFAIAISKILTDNSHDVLMWTVDKEQVLEINNERTSKFYYPNYKLSKKVKATTDLKELIDFSNIIVIALPSKFIKPTLKKINTKLKNNLNEYTFINMSKGIDNKNLVTISQIIESVIDKKNIKSIASITGASFASEILDKNITRFILASSYDNKKNIKKIFENDYIIVDESDDIIGVEILSSIKNVIALASGIIAGLGYKENTHAIIITLGLKEMFSLKDVFDISDNTIISNSGVGDLVLTASSKTSRNYITGYNVGKSMNIDEAIKSAKTVVEGVECVKSIKKIERKYKIKLPITHSMYNIFCGYKNVRDEINKLLKSK